MRIKMHPLEEVGTNVPAFLAKLWKLVEDPETNDLIHWSAEGASFVIQNTARFSRELLPLYYKHNNMASFIRQLNMYGFHKVVSLESGGLKVDKDEMEFAHPCFVIGHPYLLENIKRKIANKVEGELRPGSRTDVYGKVLCEVKSMKGRQESLDTQLVAMKRENEVLWREVALLREKHKQQQTIVNKLVHFFVNLFQADEAGNLRLKRQARLMIKDKAHTAAKVAKLDPDLVHSYFKQPRGLRKGSVATVRDGTQADTLRLDEEDCCDTDEMEDRSPEGPVIHEIDASDLLNGYSSGAELSEDEAQLLPPDLCKAVERRESRTSGSSQQRHKRGREPGDILLDVCPDIVVSPAPLDINEVIAEATDTAPIRPPPCADGRVKRKRRRRSGTSSRPTPTCLTSQNDNGLTIILPLEEMVDDPESAEMIVPELHSIHEEEADKHEECGSLEAATDSAIQAISTVAASSSTSEEERASLPACSPTGTTTRLDRWGPMEHLGNHVGTVQSELDNLREILKGEGYNLDDSTLLGIFSNDPLSYELSELPGDTDLTEDGEKEKQEFSSDPMITGTELISPGSNGLPELTDLLDWSQVSDAPGDYELILGDLGTPQLVPGSPGVAK